MFHNINKKSYIIYHVLIIHDYREELSLKTKKCLISKTHKKRRIF